MWAATQVPLAIASFVQLRARARPPSIAAHSAWTHRIVGAWGAGIGADGRVVHGAGGHVGAGACGGDAAVGRGAARGAGYPESQGAVAPVDVVGVVVGELEREGKDGGRRMCDAERRRGYTNVEQKRGTSLPQPR